MFLHIVISSMIHRSRLRGSDYLVWLVITRAHNLSHDNRQLIVLAINCNHSASLLSLRCVFDNKLTPFISGNGFGCNVMDSYFSLLNIPFVENYHISCVLTCISVEHIYKMGDTVQE